MFKALAYHFHILRRFGLQAEMFLLFSKFKKDKLSNRKIPHIKFPVSLSNFGPDVMTLFQIFFGKEYEMPFDIKPEFIIDLGANIGLSAVYYANIYPNSKIIALEPDKKNFIFLKQNTEKYSNVICLNKAIWSDRNKIRMVDIGTGNWSLQSVKAQDDEENTIEATSINDLMAEFNMNEISILKIDIEGAEKQLFSADYANWLRKTKSIAIELHPNIDPEIPYVFENAIRGMVCKKYISGENLIADLRQNNN